MGGFASSRILEVHGERMIKRTFAPGLPHRPAPEGPEPGAQRCAQPGRGPAANGGRRPADAGLRRQRHAGPRPLGAGSGAGGMANPSRPRALRTRLRGQVSQSPEAAHALLPRPPPRPPGPTPASVAGGPPARITAAWALHADPARSSTLTRALAGRAGQHPPACLARRRRGPHAGARRGQGRRIDGQAVDNLLADERAHDRAWRSRGYDHIPPDYKARAASRWSRPRTRCPTPPASARGPDACRTVRDVNLTADDQVICLISGGGSALMPLPAAEG